MLDDKPIEGFCYSYITSFGKERILMASFGSTRSLAKRHFSFHNQKRKEPIVPHKRYIVQLIVKGDAPIIRDDSCER